MISKHNPGDNLIKGRIKIELAAAGRPLSEEHIAARVRYSVERTRAMLRQLQAGGAAEFVGDGWVAR